MNNETVAENLNLKQEETLPGGGVKEFALPEKKTRKTRVYIAMPCSDGDKLPMPDRWIGAIKAMEVWHALWNDGYYPICPHLTIFLDNFFHLKYEDWLDYDKVLLELCDCLLRLGGNSAGADREIKDALLMEKTVFTSYGELLEKMPKEIEI